MPELPEVETVRRGLEPVMAGAQIAAVDLRRPDLRFPFPQDFAARLAGRQIVGLGRRAKYLLADLDDGAILVMHLGMSGSFRIEQGAAATTPGAFHHPRGGPGAHDHVVFGLGNGARVTYNDPRRFGFMTLVSREAFDAHPLFRGMGVEPLGDDFDAEHLARLLKGRATPLKAALLDQRLVAGLGNIYVCEALHRAGLSPMRAAGTLVGASGRPKAAARALAQAIRDVLGEAIAAGGSTLRDYRHADGSLGLFQHGFRVYDRAEAPCLRDGCRGIVRRAVQAGRSTFYCAVCQG